MKLRNDITGDVLEVPPPDAMGESVILFNGSVVERVLYSDEGEGSVTLGNGRVFAAGNSFADYLVEKLKTGEWRKVGRS